LRIEITSSSKPRSISDDIREGLASTFSYASSQGSVHIQLLSSHPVDEGHFSLVYGIAAGRAQLTSQVSSGETTIYLSFDEMQDLAKLFQAKLSDLMKDTASLSAEQQSTRLDDISTKLDDLIQKRSALWRYFGLFRQQEPLPGDLANQLRQTLRDQIEQLDGQIVAKDARQSALEASITDQKATAQKKLADDPVTADLKKVVELNEKKAAYVKAQVSVGAATPADASAADVAVAEARVRLAEREEEVSATGKGQLLDRLSDELAEIAVDAAELKARMAYCRHELELLNGPKDAAQLDELIKVTEELTRQPDSSAMNNDLASQIQKLSAERFALEVSDVTVSVLPGP
jgi:hypothetical protein